MFNSYINYFYVPFSIAMLNYQRITIHLYMVDFELPGEIACGFFEYEEVDTKLRPQIDYQIPIH